MSISILRYSPDYRTLLQVVVCLSYAELSGSTNSMATIHSPLMYMNNIALADFHALMSMSPRCEPTT